MKFLLVGLTLLTSLPSLAHNMPDNIIKNKFKEAIEIAVKKERINSDLSGFTIQQSSDIEIDYSIGLDQAIRDLPILEKTFSLIPKFEKYAHDDVDFKSLSVKLDRDGDQYTLNCTAVEISQNFLDLAAVYEPENLQFLYKISYEECSLKNNLTGKEKSLYKPLEVQRFYRKEKY